MKTVSLTKNKLYSGNLILVNRFYPCRNHFAWDRYEKFEGIALMPSVARLYTEIIRTIGGAGQIQLTSGWRSFEEQEQLYSESSAENGKEFTEKYVAYPGHSEHQSGLALDLALKKPDIDFIRPYFPYTGICGRFRDKALLFGFIERYPKGKEEITHIGHEPWHFRYVGTPHAEFMHRNNLTLEEYIKLLRGHRYMSNPLFIHCRGSFFEISFIPYETGNTSFEVEDGIPCSVSGNNADGFIVTKRYSTRLDIMSKNSSSLYSLS